MSAPEDAELASAEEATSSALVRHYGDAGITLKRYVDILLSRGLDWGLMGPREGERMWRRHVANSLALVDVIGNGLEVADVGSGAGLPGIPLAIVRPDLRVTLVESLQRRTEFLELAVEELGLGGRVRVVRSRAEELREEFDVVVCRAVAPLDRLVRWTAPLLASDGALVARKGESAEEEIRKAAKLLKVGRLRAEVLELQAVAGVEGTRAIRVSRDRG